MTTFLVATWLFILIGCTATLLAGASLLDRVQSPRVPPGKGTMKGGTVRPRYNDLKIASKGNHYDPISLCRVASHSLAGAGTSGCRK